MGYCFDRAGRLVCDLCGHAGGVRKMKCPFGYCPAVAACAECRVIRASEMTKAAHVKYGCKAGHLKCVLQCDMKEDCANAVTHIGEKGWVYCASCAVVRRHSGAERTRRMTAPELKKIQEGKPLEHY